MGKTKLLNIQTRNTLLGRVNAGDQEAFKEFYDLYCPAMLEYLGYCENGPTEKNEWDIVQIVFTNFYKRFVFQQTSKDGDSGPRANILSVLARMDKNAKDRGRFRPYLIACLKNAMRTLWRKETQGGKAKFFSLGEKVGPTDGRTWQEVLEKLEVDPKALDCTAAEGERLAAVLNIWQSVVMGILLDETLSDCSRDVINRSLLEEAKASDLAAKWGITENYVYKIKFDGKEKAIRITKAIYGMLGEDLDLVKETRRLYEVVSSMKPGRHMEKFMIALAEKLFKGENF
ncbi:MAG: hypothetical protein IJH50_06830 [Kiritimatiellae bacterium]|nr:hypothetical protein [Kiritimatiellia bacterium]